MLRNLKTHLYLRDLEDFWLLTFPFQVLCRSLHLFESYQESQVRGLGLREDKNYEEPRIREKDKKSFGGDNFFSGISETNEGGVNTVLQGTSTE